MTKKQPVKVNNSYCKQSRPRAGRETLRHGGMVNARIEEVHDKRNATICRKAFALTSTCEGARENIDNR